MIEFRRATDAAALQARLLRCGIAMEERYGLLTWRQPRPLQMMQPSIEAGEAWEAVNDGRVIASFALAVQPPSFYDLSYFDRHAATVAEGPLS
jgi:hypothetical protein